jgi:hypothetical protein
MCGGPQNSSRRPTREVANRRQRALAAVVVSTVALVTVLPVLATGYAGDDTINRTLPEVMARDRLTRWSVFTSLTTSWIRTEGRVYPGSVAYGTAVFSVFTTRVAYKAFLVVMLAGALVGFAWWLATATRSGMLALAGVVCVVSAWQFRSPVWHDSVTSYAGVLPYTCALIFCAGALIDSDRQRPWRLVVAAVLWALATVTYEVTVILTPAVLAVLWLRPLERRIRVRGAVAIGIPTLVDLLVVAVARSRLQTPPAPGYTLNLVPGPMLTTAWTQVVAALPLSQRWIPGAVAPSSRIGVLLVAACIPMGFATTIVIWRSSRVIAVSVRWWLLAVIGVWFWVAPSVLVGATARWQQELPTGQGYLSVMVETFGFSVVVVSALGALRCMAQARSLKWASTIALAIATLVGIAVTANIAFNIGVTLAY